MAFKCCIMLLVCFLIINPIEAVYGVVCPLAVDGTAAVVEAETEGTATGAVLAGKVVEKTACLVKSSSCKREAGTILLAFSDNFKGFDTNGDNLISYEEFLFSEDLQEPFLAADSNDDDRLDMGEFHAAPFLFAGTEAKQITSGANCNCTTDK